MMIKHITFALLITTFIATSAWADRREIYFTNGDRITGDIMGDSPESLRVKTDAAGEVLIDKTFVDMLKTFPPDENAPSAQQVKAPGVAKVEAVVPPEPEVTWSKTMSLGYTNTSGNTKKTQAILSASLNRKTKTNEATLKYRALHSTSDHKADARKYYAMMRYAYSYGRDLKWYNFYKLEGDQDRFSNIDYRLIPALGTGYWFSNNDDLKAMTELAFGYEYTNYRTQYKSEGEPVLVPRFFINKRLIDRLHLSEDFTMYPSLRALSDYRYRSETTLRNQLTERWAIKLQYIRDFNSSPVGDIKKADSTWITALDYKF